MNLLEDKEYRGWVKAHLYGKQNKKCIGCLEEFAIRNMEIDHIHPQSEGGSDDVSNLQLLCGACNKLKSASPQEVFLVKTAHLRKGKSAYGMDFSKSSKLTTTGEHSRHTIALDDYGRLKSNDKELVRFYIKQIRSGGNFHMEKVGVSRDRRGYHHNDGWFFPTTTQGIDDTVDYFCYRLAEYHRKKTEKIKMELYSYGVTQKEIDDYKETYNELLEKKRANADVLRKAEKGKRKRIRLIEQARIAEQRIAEGKTFAQFYVRNIAWTLPVSIAVPVVIILVLLNL